MDEVDLSVWNVTSDFICLVLVENQSHCDFVKLRNMLIRSHMHDLKDVTCDVHYENYRAQCIQEMTRYLWRERKAPSSWVLPASPFLPHFVLLSKLAQDNRMESPVPILPLSTPDVETEKLIRMKDEEVRSTYFCSSTNIPHWLWYISAIFHLIQKSNVQIFVGSVFLSNKRRLVLIVTTRGH